MRLIPRLWIFGALVPVLGMATAFLLAGEIFRHSLQRALDEALLAQATVEGVSLFDSPEQEVHLHMELSPLLEQVRPFAPVASVYGPDGGLLLAFPRGSEVPAHLAPSPRLSDPVLETRGRTRELRVTLLHPRQREPYTLRLAASLGGIAQTIRRYHLAAGLLTGAFAILLGAFQAAQARSLGRRVGALASHLKRVGQGELDQDPAPDPTGDELSELRDGVAQATLELRRIRDARERLLADAAHELRTPLAAMRTSLDLALRRQRSPEELREALSETRDEVDRLAALSSRLLDLTAVRSAPFVTEALDLRAVAGHALGGLRALAEERGIRIELEPGPPLWIQGDPSRIRQAIDNVLDNALKHSAAGGRIRLRLRSEKQMARLTIDDEGPGVPASQREALFAPFGRGASHLPGVGLGLALVREIAARHGGSARFEDPPAGKGARFLLTFPI